MPVLHDAIFEQFRGLRRLTVEGVDDYFFSDAAALACLTGIEELNMRQWQDNPFTDAGLKHLAGIRKLDFNDTYSFHITSEGFRHLSGIANLYVVALVYDDDENIVWQMSDDALRHLRGVRTLAFTEVLTGLTGLELAAEGITDAGFAHLRGVRHVRVLSDRFSLTATAFVTWLA